MYQLPACAGKWWVISPCPFLHSWAFCSVYSPLPAKEGSDRRILGGTWYPAGAIHHHGSDTWQKRKGRIALNETFSEESRAIFNYPSYRYAQKIKLLKLWTRLFFHWRKKVPFKYVSTKKFINTPDKRHSQPTFIACECFYGQLTNCSQQVLQSNENSQDLCRSHGQRSEHMEFTLSQPQCSSPSPALPLQMVQGCSTHSWGHFQLMTKQWWQNSQTARLRLQTRLPEHRQRAAKKASPDATTKPPRTATVMERWEESVSECKLWVFSGSLSGGSTRAGRASSGVLCSSVTQAFNLKHLNSFLISLMLDVEFLGLMLTQIFKM